MFIGANVLLNNVTISDFKLGIVNEGIIETNNCKFVNNVNKNILKDNALLDNQGGAIHNYNILYCMILLLILMMQVIKEQTQDVNIHLTFTTRGGAICADPNSKTFIFNCIFKKRKDNIYLADDAFVFINTTENNIRNS